MCGLVPWHLRGLDQSMCVCRLYMAWTQAFFCHPSLHMRYPDRGVVWCSVQSVFTPPLTRLLLPFPPPQDMCICMLTVNDPSLQYGQFFPPRGHESEYEGALSRRVHTSTCVQPGPVPKYRSSCLSACDTVCPSGCDVLRS